MPPLRNVSQNDAIRSFCRLGGEELNRRGKGSHRVIKFNSENLIIPRGVLKIGLLKSLIKTAGITEQEFVEHL